MSFRRRFNLISWAFYDFANSPYSTIMTTLIFPIFFMENIVSTKWAMLIWAILYGGSEIFAAIISPPMGALSDILKRRKIFLIVFSLLSIFGTLLTVTLQKGEVLNALFFFFLAQIGFSLSQVFYNSLLEQISEVEKREWVSGFGWGMGYLGGMIFMALMILISSVESQKFIRLNFLFTALWYLIFSLPIFFFFEKRISVKVDRVLFRDAYKEVIKTMKKLKDNKNLFLFILASFFLNDGVNSAILFGGIYLRKIYNFDLKSLYLFFIAFNLVAAVGAFLIGFVADKIGSKKMLNIITFLWIVSIFFLPFSENLYFLLSIASLIGILIGGTQSVLRGFLSTLAPPDSQGEWFGFYSLVGKAASLFGPLLFGTTYGISENLKLSALSLIPLFLLGYFFLRYVQESKTK